MAPTATTGMPTGRRPPPGSRVSRAPFGCRNSPLTAPLLPYSQEAPVSARTIVRRHRHHLESRPLLHGDLVGAKRHAVGLPVRTRLAGGPKVDEQRAEP